MKSTLKQDLVALMAATVMTLCMLGGVDRLAQPANDAAAAGGWAGLEQAQPAAGNPV
jgi:hypothetical protein